MTNHTIESQICLNRPTLEKLAMKFTRNLEDANDLVQETILKAIRFSNHFERETNLAGWLHTIMRNTYINDYRKRTRRNALIDTSETLTSSQLRSSAARNEAEISLVMEDIQKAFREMPAEYSVPFLSYFEGYKYHEIAEELNLPIGTVKTRIFMARKYLKKQLKMYEDLYGNNFNGKFINTISSNQYEELYAS